MGTPEARDPVVEAYKRDLDLTLLRRNLRKSPEERILTAMERPTAPISAAPRPGCRSAGIGRRWSAD